MLGTNSHVTRKTSIISHLYEDTPVYVRLKGKTVVAVWLDRDGKVNLSYDSKKVWQAIPANL